MAIKQKMSLSMRPAFSMSATIAHSVLLPLRSLPPPALLLSASRSDHFHSEKESPPTAQTRGFSSCCIRCDLLT